MTHILEQSQPQNNFLLIKKENIQRGDRIIFQSLEDGKQIETEVLLTNVQDGQGLMKGYKIISWVDSPSIK